LKKSLVSSKGRTVRSLLIVLLSAIVIFITVVSVYLTPDDLKGCAGVSQNSGCQKADAIVAISGGNTSDRAVEAIKLYKQGWADTIIFSGAAADTSGPSNAVVMRRQAIAAGVPANAIETESQSQTTKQNAERTKALLVKVGSGGANRVILVTSPYHQRRASLEFTALAGPGITIINHPVQNDSDWPTLWWLTPRGWWLAMGELVKIIAFYMGESQ
jgi:uncharacterized SAM-binding protein YcdF (DUF218 family)